MPKLSVNFDSAEFFGPVKEGTSLKIVEELQRIREDKKRSVSVRGTYYQNTAFNVTYTIQGERDIKTLTVGRDWVDIPVFGPDPVIDSLLLSSIGSAYPEYSKIITAGLSVQELVALHALLQVGYSEKLYNWTVFNADMGLNRIAWCAVFYHWCVKRAYAVAGKPPVYRYDSRLANSRATLRSAPVQVFQPEKIKPGFAVIWGSRANPVSGHTGICVDNDTDAGELTIVEGNLKDGVRLVKRKYRYLNSSRLQFLGGCSYAGDVPGNRVYGGKNATEATGDENTV